MERNTTVYTYENVPILLLSQLDAGGEGKIYLTNKGNVVKLFDEEHLSIDKKKKISLIISKKIRYPGICFPENLIYDSQRKFIGYSMSFVEGKKMSFSIFEIAQIDIKISEGWNRVNLATLALTILEKIEFLHKQNILVGDVNAANILIKSDSEIYFVDTDSFQIDRYPGAVGSILYTPPELQGRNLRFFLRTKEHEYYSIATLLFMIFLPGKNPFAYQGGGNLIENIKAMNFSYPLDDQDNKKAPKGVWEFIWIELSYEIRKAFHNVFKKGRRVSVTHWKLIIEAYKKELATGIYQTNIFPTHTEKIEPDIKRDFTGDVTDNEYWLRKDKTEITLNTINPKIAIIELSTNAIRFLYGDQEKIKTLGFSFDYFARGPGFSDFTNTGAATNSKGILDMSFIDNVIVAKLKEKFELAKSSKIDVVYSVATAAYRAARNRNKVIESIRLKSGFNVKILKKKEEAQASIFAFFHARPQNLDYDANKKYMFIDQGGGSTEISIFHGQNISETYSINLGTTALRNILFNEATDNTTFEKAFKDVEKFAKDRLRTYLEKYNPQNIANYCIGVGNAIIQATDAKSAYGKHGKIMNIEYLREKIKMYDSEIKKYYNLRQLRDEINRELNEQIIKLEKSNQIINSVNARLALPMFIEIMQRFRIEKIVSSNVSLCYGIYFEKLLQPQI